MKKIISILALFIFLFTGCSKKEELTQYDKIVKNDVLTVGVKTDAKPFGYINKVTGKNEGFDVDVAKYIAREILGTDKKIKFVKVSPSSRIEAVTSGEVDMVIATMSITPQRQLFLDFSVPYYIAGQTAVVRKDSDIYTFADLKKKTTIVVLGTTAEANLRRIVPTAKIVGYRSYDEAWQALLDGAGDAFINDDTILAPFVYKNKNFRLLKNKLSYEPYGIAIKKEESNKKLKHVIDVVITRMNKDGTLKYLNKKWHLK